MTLSPLTTPQTLTMIMMMMMREEKIHDKMDLFKNKTWLWLMMKSSHTQTPFICAKQVTNTYFHYDSCQIHDTCQILFEVLLKLVMPALA